MAAWRPRARRNVPAGRHPLSRLLEIHKHQALTKNSSNDFCRVQYRDSLELCESVAFAALEVNVEFGAS